MTKYYTSWCFCISQNKVVTLTLGSKVALLGDTLCNYFLGLKYKLLDYRLQEVQERIAYFRQAYDFCLSFPIKILDMTINQWQSFMFFFRIIINEMNLVKCNRRQISGWPDTTGIAKCYKDHVLMGKVEFLKS